MTPTVDRPRAVLATVVQEPAGAAYAPKVGGLPDSGGYMIAGYLVTFVIYVGYVAMILRRMARLRRTTS